MKKHYFLLSTVVGFTTETQLERSKPINVLGVYSEMNWDIKKLGHAQNMAVQRYHQLNDPEVKTKVHDVFIQSINYMGHMTQEEWLGQFQQVETGQPDGYATDPQVQAETPATEEDNQERSE